MGGFEGLRFVHPIELKTNSKTYWSIRLDTLSPEQLEFLVGHFRTDIRYTPKEVTQDIIMGSLYSDISDWYSNDRLWTNATSNLSIEYPSYVKLSFNDLFEEEV